MESAMCIYCNVEWLGECWECAVDSGQFPPVATAVSREEVKRRLFIRDSANIGISSDLFFARRSVLYDIEHYQSPDIHPCVGNL